MHSFDNKELVMIVFKNRVGNEVKIFAKTLEEEAYKQIEQLANFEPYLYEKIRIMPDAHAGIGCTVGTTMTVSNKVTPNIVGVDIGCGMHTVKLKESDIDLVKLDKTIREEIPSGFSIRKKAVARFDFSNLVSAVSQDLKRAALSIGTLGGGNHFIEINRDSSGSLYMVVHSGSRNFGLTVCNHYQKLAYRETKDILKSLDAHKTLAYLQGESFHDYLNDMNVAQNFAALNRTVIADIIIKKMKLTPVMRFENIHNYIDTEDMIIRKGAVRAKAGELLLIPINMRDGSLLCRGKGNSDWNFSAPHGAGRVMSRRKAKESIDIKEFYSSMEGIFTTSLSRKTLDEAPPAYKPMEEIIDAIQDSAVVIDQLKPIYNFKAD